MKSLTFSQRRNFTVFAFSVRMFLTAAEDGVILPSLWLYLQMFHADYWYFGLVLSAYFIVSIGSTLLVGHLVDRNTSRYLLGFLWNLAEVVGNIIYSLHFNMYLPLVGRMVAGFGEGYASAIWAELAKITTQEERVRYFTLINVSYFLGVAFGPVLNLFLKEFDFYIGYWHIDYRTSPGFFMALMWILAIVIMFVFVYDFSDEMRKERGYQLVSDSPKEGQFSKKKQLYKAYNMESQEGKHGDMTPLTSINDDVVKMEEIAKEHNSIFSDDSTRISSSGSFRDALMDMFTKFHVIVAIYSIFFIYILHSSLQGITPLIAEHTLHLNKDNVTFLFTIWGVEITLCAIALVFFLPKIPNRVLLLTSAIFGTLSSLCVILLAFFSSTYCLFVAIALDGIGVTIIDAVGRPSVSKQTNSDNQGIVQAIMTVLNRVSSLGSLLGSSLFTNQIILAIILSGSQIFGLILVILSFRNTKPQ